MARRYTLSRLARELGIDKSTVSRALRNEPGVAEDTRARVLERAHAAGYRPDPVFSKAAANRFVHASESLYPRLAWIRLAEDSREASSCLRGAKDAAGLLGYRITEIGGEPDLDSEAIRDHLLDLSVSAIILNTHNLSRPIPALPWDRFAVVACGEGFHGPAIHRVTPDARTGMEMAWRKAIENGYRRIGFCADFHSVPTSSNFEQTGVVGYEQIRCQPWLDPLPILNTRDPRTFLAWVVRNEPDVVVLSRPDFMDALARSGYRVPEDIATILLRPSGKYPDAARVATRPDALGKTAVELVDQLLREFETGIPKDRLSIRTEPVWRDGTTLPKQGDPEPELLEATIPDSVVAVSFEHTTHP